MPVQRITDNLLVVIGALLAAHEQGEALSRYALAKRTGRDRGGIIHPMMDRFEESAWVEAKWEKHDPEVTSQPSRRMYTLTPIGVAAARQLLGEPDRSIEP